jgi:hypothetical protein
MPTSDRVRAVSDVLVAGPRFLTAPLYRHRHLRWGATDGEVAAAMPGDELIPTPSFVATRAITIAAPPEHVWPWLVQMGWHRGGWYTPHWVDRLLFPWCCTPPPTCRPAGGPGSGRQSTGPGPSLWPTPATVPRGCCCGSGAPPGRGG